MAGEVPHRLSAVVNELFQNASLFLREFRLNEQRMRDILKALQENAKEAEKLQDETNKLNEAGSYWKRLGAARTIFAVATGVAVGVFVSSQAIKLAVAVAAAGGAVLAPSQVTVWHGLDKALEANIKKAFKERDLKKGAEELGEEFMAIVRPLTGTLEEIKKVSDQMKEKSAMLNTSSGLQATGSVSEIDEFHRLLTSDGGNAIDFVVQLAKQCSTVVKELHEMKTLLQELENA